MDIIVVYWKIKPDMEQDFLEWWRSGLGSKPEGLIEEHLSKVEPDETSTWDLSNSKYVTYLNVGKWKDKKYWKKVFSGQAKLQPFEAALRERIWVSVKDTRE
ncbi:MAG: hypothetical protein HY833_03145 [Candidatus Aenigmarchaeota archaeon]|nr:hypothetical protein [Candidatus Aenigmarchaeota archaeon]